MGLIKAGIGALTGVLEDSWREYFYCDALGSNVLAARGRKRVGGKSSNTKGDDNIISNGSIINVSDGQCALIVDGGKVAEVCAEPGEFVFDSSTQPSIFSGELGDSIMNTFKEIGKRFTFGGQAAGDQRVYYINTKEVMDNKYGTTTPILFRVYDKNIGLDVDVSLRCNGEYSYKIANPVLFYTNVCGNFADTYASSNLDSMLKTEVVTALQPALGKISDKGVRPSALPSHTMEICDALNEILNKKWGELRGLTICSFNMNPVSLSKEDQDLIKNLQRTAVMRDPGMAAAHLTEAQGEAMKTAAGNAGGAAMGFFGMNMAAQAGGINAGNLFNMAAASGAAASQSNSPSAPAPAGSWTCSCGQVSTGNFCTSCGAKKPEKGDSWTCSCGSSNQGKFCTNCGKPKPAGVPLYKCDKCGWEPEDPTNPPKFCPECGDPFDANDIV
ncbi:MAG: SPFH domain-containing protein [Oscillospiraceae bacterium]|nr:SPFH domain-containing protein [Oscillospiraceae bacterium]